MTFLVKRMCRAALFGGIAALLALALPAHAADYPSRPVTLVVAFPPGGPSDVLARIVGKKMEELLGAPFVIENRPGAGGNIAADFVAHATADGYTLLMGNNSILATNESLYKKLTYSPQKDFMPITLIGTQANILVVNPNVPAHSLKELIALCQGAARQDQFRFVRLWRGRASRRRIVQDGGACRYRARALQGRGARAAGRDRRPRPDDVRHRGLRGRPHQRRPGARAGRDHAQAHGGPARLPTMDEAGLKGFDASTWHGLVAPTGTPPEIVAKLHDAAVKALHDPGVQASLGRLGVDIVGDTPEQFKAYIAAEIPKWTAIVKASGANGSVAHDPEKWEPVFG